MIILIIITQFIKNILIFNKISSYDSLGYYLDLFTVVQLLILTRAIKSCYHKLRAASEPGTVILHSLYRIATWFRQPESLWCRRESSCGQVTWSRTTKNGSTSRHSPTWRYTTPRTFRLIKAPIMYKGGCANKKRLFKDQEPPGACGSSRRLLFF